MYGRALAPSLLNRKRPEAAQQPPNGSRCDCDIFGRARVFVCSSSVPSRHVIEDPRRFTDMTNIARGDPPRASRLRFRVVMLSRDQTGTRLRQVLCDRGKIYREQEELVPVVKIYRYPRSPGPGDIIIPSSSAETHFFTLVGFLNNLGSVFMFIWYPRIFSPPLREARSVSRVTQQRKGSRSFARGLPLLPRVRLQ